ncbi:hypothetical protein QN277_000619 [Acacia crassicarpa]|uniref:Uncharacterized protein n=1 Tax=Acacia crassicarpa TaxID=499986 RepID=A0AAE1N6W7_9FABA|nr:hypothetical protein QN277_000619 [Acacia crassicarpa]
MREVPGHQEPSLRPQFMKGLELGEVALGIKGLKLPFQ